ncbi:MAG TPA: toast rack family protein [Cytophagales bacterium]
MDYYLHRLQAVRTLLGLLSSRLRFPFVPASLPPPSGLPFLVLVALAPAAFGQQTSSQLADLKGLKSLTATIRISAGTLKLTAGDAPAAESKFTYSRPAWKPRVTFSREGGQGRLAIEQPEAENMNMNDKERNDWEIRLSRAIPTDLTLRMGAGEGTVDLRGAKVRRLEMKAGAGAFKVNLANTSVADLQVDAGVGELTLDLTGERTANLRAVINGGIGDLNVMLPRKTGVRVKISGLGSFDSPGFRKQGDYYVNDAYGKTPNSLDLSVSGGLGDLELSLKD